MSDLIVVTNWEEVEKDDWYLSDDWDGNGDKEKAIELAKEGKLFEAYIVSAKDLALYGQMDADQIFIDRDGNEILTCETQVIDDQFMNSWEYDAY